MSQPAANNGQKVYTLLVEINTRTGLPTGRVKPNIPSDPNYIAPVEDLTACPLPGPPVFNTYDVNVVIPGGFTANIQLLYGTLHIDRNTPGTWNIVDRTYDGVVFQVTAVGEVSYIVSISYGSGANKQTAVNGTGNTYIPGPFTAITQIAILPNTGDYNTDYNDDYFN